MTIAFMNLFTIVVVITLFAIIFLRYGLPPRPSDWITGVVLAIAFIIIVNLAARAFLSD